MPMHLQLCLAMPLIISQADKCSHTGFAKVSSVAAAIACKDVAVTNNTVPQNGDWTEVEPDWCNVLDCQKRITICDPAPLQVSVPKG